MTNVISQDTEEMVASNWARLGVMFAIPMAAESPDLELLLLDTARCAPHNVRLLILGASWLVRYGQCVAKRRLARLVEETLEDEHLPVMGLLLDWVQQRDRRHRRRFAEAIAMCHSADIPAPLLDVDRRNPALWPMIERTASPLSRQWGRWLEEFTVRDDALRPPEWLADHNPALRLRALVSGELAATIMAEATADSSVLQNESELARRCQASRSTIRDALLRLRMAGLLYETKRGREDHLRVRGWFGGGGNAEREREREGSPL